MGALAEMLSKGADESPPGPTGGGDADARKMAEASVKAFYEACKSGDYKSATDHLSSAMEHCQAYPDDGSQVEDEGGSDDGGGMPAVMLVAHKK